MRLLTTLTAGLLVLGLTASVQAQSTTDDPPPDPSTGEEAPPEPSTGEEAPPEPSTGEEAPPEPSTGEEAPPEEETEEETEEDEGLTVEINAGQSTEASGPQGDVPISAFDTIKGLGWKLDFRADWQSGGQGGKADSDFSVVWRSVTPTMSYSSRFDVSINANFPDEGDSTYTTDIKGKAGPNADLASFTIDKYLGFDVMDAPGYVFIEPEVSIRTVTGQDTEKKLALFGGVGFGRMYPSANYERVYAFVKVLKNAGLLSRPLTKADYTELMGILQNRWDREGQTARALAKLEALGALSTKAGNDVMGALYASVEESYDYKEQGSDFRIGIWYDVLGDETETSPLDIVVGYTKAFGKDRIVFQPFIYFYQQIQPETLSFLSAVADLRYLTSPQTEWFLTESLTYRTGGGGSSYWNNQLEGGVRYSLLSYLSAELKATHQTAKGQDESDIGLFATLNVGGRGI